MHQKFPGAGKDDRRTIAQIYRLRDEQLEICYKVSSAPQGKPPANFDASAGTGQALITLERVKAGEPKAKKP
jgi:hypothetical protein